MPGYKRQQPPPKEIVNGERGVTNYRYVILSIFWYLGKNTSCLDFYGKLRKMNFKSIKRKGCELLKSPFRKEFQFCSLAQEMNKRPKVSK